MSLNPRQVVLIGLGVMVTRTLGFTEWADPASAQQRLDLPRYSLDVPAGWSSQVENERWTLYLIGAANDLGIAQVGNGLAIGLTLTRADAHRQLWATAQS